MTHQCTRGAGGLSPWASAQLDGAEEENGRPRERRMLLGLAGEVNARGAALFVSFQCWSKVGGGVAAQARALASGIDAGGAREAGCRGEAMARPGPTRRTAVNGDAVLARVQEF